jgi:hypothetical protein
MRCCSTRGNGVGDVAKMNRADIVDGELHVIQQKTGAELFLPVVPELERALKAYPAKGLTLIGKESGKPLSRAALSHLMRAAIKDAGLPAKCVSHGLRKAARRKSRSRRFPATRPCERSNATQRQRIKGGLLGMRWAGAKGELRLPNARAKSA